MDRVRRSALHIAQSLGEVDLRVIELAALFHDLSGMSTAFQVPRDGQADFVDGA